MNKVKIVVSGSRDFIDYDLLKREFDALVKEWNLVPEKTVILSGKCRGADALSERWAREFGAEVWDFYPNWDKHGKAAGPIRNLQMVTYGTHAVVFFNGSSRGAKDLINKATQKGLVLKVVNI